MDGIDELMRELSQIARAAEGLATLKEQGIDFEQARTMMVNQKGMTMGQATTQIEAMEKLTSIRLERKDEPKQA